MPLFLSPLFLFAALAAAVPLALHLLNRRTPPPMTFSTLRFLREAMAQTRRARRVTQILLLILRILLVLLIAAAFGRPRVQSSSWLPDSPRVVILAIDATASMQCREQGSSRFAAAVEWAGVVTGALTDQDKCALVLLGSPDWDMVFPASRHHVLVSDALKTATCATTTSNLAQDLRRLISAAVDEHSGELIEVHLFSDYQAGNWPLHELQDMDKELERRGIRLFFNRIGSAEVANSSVAAVRPTPEAIIGAGTVDVRVRIGASPYTSGDTNVKLLFDGVEQDRKGAELIPGERQVVTLSATVDATGEFVTGSVHIDEDALALDNVRYFVLEKRSGIRVLLVDGGVSELAPLGDTWYLRRALNPRLSENPLILPDTIQWSALQGKSLEPYDAILAANPPPFGSVMALKLEGYVKAGGLLVLYPGNRGGLEAGLAHIRPLASIRVRKQRFDVSRKFSLLHSSKPHILEGRLARIMADTPSFTGNTRLLLSHVDPGWTPRAFYQQDNGTPCLLPVKYERGEIWVSSLAADRMWSEWPLSPFFVIFHQELLKGRVTGRGRTISIDSGETATLAWSGPELELDIQVDGPDGLRRGLQVTRVSRGQAFILRGLTLPGVHRIQMSDDGSGVIYAAVNTPVVESDLAAVSDTYLAQSLPRSQVHVTHDVREQQAMVSELQRGQPLWPWLLLVAMCVAIIELAIANLRSVQRAGAAPLIEKIKQDRIFGKGQ